METCFRTYRSGYHAFYSREASKKGSLDFKLIDGSGTVEATAIFKTRSEGEETYDWADKVYQGEVEESPVGIHVPFNPYLITGDPRGTR